MQPPATAGTQTDRRQYWTQHCRTVTALLPLAESNLTWQRVTVSDWVRADSWLTDQWDRQLLCKLHTCPALPNAPPSSHRSPPPPPSILPPSIASSSLHFHYTTDRPAGLPANCFQLFRTQERSPAGRSAHFRTSVTTVHTSVLAARRYDTRTLWLLCSARVSQERSVCDLTFRLPRYSNTRSCPRGDTVLLAPPGSSVIQKSRVKEKQEHQQKWK